MKKNILTIVLCAVTILSLNSCGNKNKKASETVEKKSSVSLSGAGATFPLPYYNMSFEDFQTKTGVKVSYGGIGSGGGIRNLSDEVVDFAGSDAYMSDEEMSKVKPVVHFPTCLGAVVVAYNLNGIKELNLTGELIADIFAGNVTKWNDKRIKDLNADIQLPDKSIIPVFRSDGSGTTFVFTDYLTKVSKMWAEKYGSAKSVNFPAGQAAKGNPGVAGIIGQTDGTIGYIGSEYAFAQDIRYAKIKNQQGEFITPDAQSISAAAKGDIPDDTRTMITNSDSKGAYPISCFTWIIIYKEQNYSGRDKDQAEETVNLIAYMMSNEAQKKTTEVNFAPLPKAAIDKSLKNLKTITYNGEVLYK